MKLSFPARAAILLAAVLGTASCGRKAPPAAEAAPPSVADRQEVTFGTGFHKEEAFAPASALRWVRQDAALRVQVPGDGRYRLTFRPFTVFSKVENVIEVSVGGQSVGKFSTHASDMSAAVPTPLEVSLHAGSNEVNLHSTQPEVRLGENDDRPAAFGLLLPVGVERLP